LCVRGTTRLLSDADRSWGRPVLVVSWMSEARYDGVCPANDCWTRHASLNITPRRTGGQCRTGVICLHRRVPVTRRAVIRSAQAVRPHGALINLGAHTLAQYFAGHPLKQGATVRLIQPLYNIIPAKFLRITTRCGFRFPATVPWNYV